jgi:hypothetical protein
MLRPRRSVDEAIDRGAAIKVISSDREVLQDVRMGAR